MAEPTYLLSIYTCARCGAVHRTRAKNISPDAPGRTFEKTLKICVSCASDDMRPWQNREKH